MHTYHVSAQQVKAEFIYQRANGKISKVFQFVSAQVVLLNKFPSFT